MVCIVRFVLHNTSSPGSVLSALPGLFGPSTLKRLRYRHFLISDACCGLVCWQQAHKYSLFVKALQTMQRGLKENFLIRSAFLLRLHRWPRPRDFGRAPNLFAAGWVEHLSFLNATLHGISVKLALQVRDGACFSDARSLILGLRSFFQA